MLSKSQSFFTGVDAKTPIYNELPSFRDFYYLLCCVPEFGSNMYLYLSTLILFIRIVYSYLKIQELVFDVFVLLEHAHLGS